MRWLKDLLEHGGVKILTPEDVLFAWLLDLDDDGDDEKDKDDAAGHTDDGPVCVVEVVQNVGFPFFCTENEIITCKTSFDTFVCNTSQL